IENTGQDVVLKKLSVFVFCKLAGPRYIPFVHDFKERILPPDRMLTLRYDVTDEDLKEIHMAHEEVGCQFESRVDLTCADIWGLQKYSYRCSYPAEMQRSLVSPRRLSLVNRLLYRAAEIVLKMKIYQVT